MKKILVITPRFPYPEAGADEQDRAGGIRQLVRLGFEVRVIAKYFDWQPAVEIKKRWRAIGVDVVLVPYQKRKRLSLVFDGAAAEYADPAMRRSVQTALKEFKPDLAWFDYTYLWPLYRLVKRCGLPIAVRSINVESRHFLEEDGQSFLNYLKFVPKYLTEEKTARGADVLFSITPVEQAVYKRLGARQAVNLPLRGLASALGTHAPRETAEYNVFFSGSTYSVPHNRQALQFILKDVAPAMLKTHGTGFRFHVTGAKFPEEFKKYLSENVSYEGFVENFDEFLQTMDIALSPSLAGAGMQQKIFEPLARGFPTITHARGLAGYDFVHNEDVLCVEFSSDVIAALEKCMSFDVRVHLSDNAKEKSRKYFSQEAVDGIVALEIGRLMK